MIVNLEAGDLLIIATPQGMIAVNPDPDTGATLVTVAYSEGYKLTPKMSCNFQTGQQDAHVWIEPAV